MKRNLPFATIVLTLLLTCCGQRAAAPAPTSVPSPTDVPPTPAPTPTPAISTELGSIDEAVDRQIQALMEVQDIPRSPDRGAGGHGSALFALNTKEPTISSAMACHSGSIRAAS